LDQSWVKRKKYDTESREERNIVHAIKRRKADWIGYILRRNCLVIHASKKIYKGGEDEEEDVRSCRMKLQDDFKQKVAYLNVEEEAVVRIH
jgi:hypothetical protein